MARADNIPERTVPVRNPPFMAALAVAVAAPMCPAATYTIGFDALASMGGQSATTTIAEGPFDVRVSDALVVGPGDPAYAGRVGLIPQAGVFTVDIYGPPGPGGYAEFLFRSLTADFAPGPGGSDISWFVFYRTAYGAYDQFRGSAPASLASDPFAAPAPMDQIMLQAHGFPEEAQLLGVAIDADFFGQGGGPGAAPEPSGLLLAAIGAIGVMRWRTRSGRRRPSPGRSTRP